MHTPLCLLMNLAHVLVWSQFRFEIPARFVLRWDCTSIPTLQMIPLREILWWAASEDLSKRLPSFSDVFVAACVYIERRHILRYRNREHSVQFSMLQRRLDRHHGRRRRPTFSSGTCWSLPSCAGECTKARSFGRGEWATSRSRSEWILFTFLEWAPHCNIDQRVSSGILVTPAVGPWWALTSVVTLNVACEEQLVPRGQVVPASGQRLRRSDTFEWQSGSFHSAPAPWTPHGDWLSEWEWDDRSEGNVRDGIGLQKGNSGSGWRRTTSLFGFQKGRKQLDSSTSPSCIKPYGYYMYISQYSLNDPLAKN